MEIRFFCPYWGMSHIPLEEVLEKIKTAGYDGVELAINPDIEGYEQAVHICNKYNLLLIAQHPYARGNTPEEHLDDYTRKLEMILALAPLMVNCHTGKDFYSMEQNLLFLNAATKLADKYQIPIAHETHRGRFAFCTTVTEQYLDALPKLALTADFSHWCVVSESLLEAQQPVMDKIIPHCIHLHARVGYSQGAQVPDPAAPEYEPALNAHMKWWKQIVQQHIKAGKQQITITCEFGPPPYLPVLPFTMEPVASQWELNLFMKDYLTKNILV